MFRCLSRLKGDTVFLFDFHSFTLYEKNMAVYMFECRVISDGSKSSKKSSKSGLRGKLDWKNGDSMEETEENKEYEYCKLPNLENCSTDKECILEYLKIANDKQLSLIHKYIEIIFLYRV